MGSDPYMSFFLSSAVEIPGYISCLLLMDRWGRRLPLSVFMVFSGVASISTALLSPGLTPQLRTDDVSVSLLLTIFFS